MRKHRWKINVSGIVTIVVIVGVWELVVGAGWVHLQFVPSPIGVGRAFKRDIGDGSLLVNALHTCLVVLLGWALAVPVGVLAGSAMALVKPVRGYMSFTVDALRAIPIVAFVPVALLILGFSDQMEVLLCFYGALWPILISSYRGLMATDSRLIEVGSMFRFSAVRKFWRLRLPAATPTVMTGLRLGMGLSLALAVVAELVGNPQGLGHVLVVAEQSLQPGTMVAYVIATGLIGILLDSALVGIARVIFRGQMLAAGDAP